ncbi:MAG TPA: hypothetical protein VG452_00510, partial [Egibacteraceae bacterium]|nr:hypothetical protein [Egibacteraceae bacterium]
AAGPPPEALGARHAPLYAGDLADAVVAADRQRRDAADLHLVVTLAGPDVVTVGELAARLREQARRGVRGRRRGGPTGAAALPPAAVDLLARAALPGPDAVGRRGTSLAEGLRRVREETWD